MELDIIMLSNRGQTEANTEGSNLGNLENKKHKKVEGRLFLRQEKQNKGSIILVNRGDGYVQNTSVETLKKSEIRRQQGAMG